MLSLFQRALLGRRAHKGAIVVVDLSELHRPLQSSGGHGLTWILCLSHPPRLGAGVCLLVPQAEYLTRLATPNPQNPS